MVTTPITNNDIDAQWGEAIKRQLGDSIRKPIRVFLGNPSSPSDPLYFNTEKTFVWICDDPSEPNLISAIPKAGIPSDKLLQGTAIRVKRVVNGFEYVGLDVDYDTQFSQNDAQQISQKPVLLSQLSYGTVHPYSGFNLLIRGSFYGTVWKGDALTGAITSLLDTSAAALSLPTTNNRAKGVLIQYDTVTTEFSYKQSGEFNASVSLEQEIANLPTADSDCVRVAYIRLYKGQIAIAYEDIFQAPDWNGLAPPAAPLDATYIVQTPNSDLTNEQALSALATGFMKSATGTGVVTTQSQISVASDVTGTLPIGNGGTGQTTALPAFDALAPSSSKGDIITHTGAASAALAVATDGRVLTSWNAASGGVDWKGSLVELVLNELGSDQTTITFSSIPATFQDLLFVINPRSSAAGTAVLVTFNADTGNNYAKLESQVDNAAALTQVRNINQTSISCANASVASTGTTAYFGSLSMMIKAYCNAGNRTRKAFYEAGRFTGATDITRAWGFAAWEDVANPISSIELNLSAGDFLAGTTYALYGIGSYT